jgi:hypothetical protein
MAHFYQAGMFWVTVAGAAISLGVGLVAAFIALKSAPKRRLFYGMSDPVAILSPDGAKHGLEVRRGGRQLTDPCLVELALHSSGRQSINSGLFDQGRPLSLHLHAPIVDLLKAASRPTEQAIPDYQWSGSTLDIGPGVLARRQRITFTVLVDGKPRPRPRQPRKSPSSEPTPAASATSTAPPLTPASPRSQKHEPRFASAPNEPKQT